MKRSNEVISLYYFILFSLNYLPRTDYAAYSNGLYYTLGQCGYEFLSYVRYEKQSYNLNMGYYQFESDRIRRFFK